MLGKVAWRMFLEELQKESGVTCRLGKENGAGGFPGLLKVVDSIVKQ